jgi:osmotically-inducible protein OsmY
MKTNRELQDDVIDELRWEPRVDASAIGVSAEDGSVTLTGHASSYIQKLDAVRAAERVDGVTAVADELEVHVSGDPRDDADVAKAIADAVKWSSTVPTTVHAEVTSGWVNLTGEVDWSYQRDDAVGIVQGVKGIKGVTNLVTLKPRTSPVAVEDEIRDAFERNADLDANGISVTVSDGKVELSGQVHSLHEANIAESAAWSAPGVHSVERHLTVTP